MISTEVMRRSQIQGGEDSERELVETKWHEFLALTHSARLRVRRRLANKGARKER